MTPDPPIRTLELPEIRRLFPGTEEQVYLDVSLNALVPTTARDAIVRHLERRVMGRVEKPELHAQAEVVRGQVARLLAAHPDEIAITKNTSEGLNLFAASLPWEPGDNVVLCPGLEHPNNVLLWQNLRDGRGVELREIPPVDGHMPVDGMVEAVDHRTRVVAASHVTFSPGFVTDLASLARGAHSRGALLLVDAAQSAGALGIDVGASDVDALALGTQKSLLGLYGLGFLFVRRELANAIRPVFAARYGVDLGPGANETAIGGGELRFHAGARRFDLSNYSYVALAGIEASLGLILSLGMDRVERHVRGLAARLASGLLDAGLPVAGGRPGSHLAHIVAVGDGGGGRGDGADDPAMDELHRHLTRNRVRLSIRRGVLRMSLAIYNDREDVERVVELCRTWKAGA